MQKLLKVLKSRYFISGIVILLEFVQLLVVFILLNKYSTIVAFLGYIFYVGVFLYIINKYKSPEFKLPWVIIMMLFFVVGAFVFMLFVSDNQNKKTIDAFKKNKKKEKDYLKDNDVLDKLKSENIDAYLQANYIKEATGLLCYRNTKVSFYKLGEEFHKELLLSLEKASNYIFMEYFIIEEGQMWDPIYEILKKKSNDGVKVYLIYDDFGCMATLDEAYYEKLNKDGIHCIPSNKFRPVLSNIHNNRDHRKITVIDGKVGFTGGVNLADEYINAKEKFGHWKDTAIKLEGEAVKNLVALFLEVWNSQNKIKLNHEDYMNEKYEKIDDGVVVPYGDGPEIFYKDSIGKNVYINMINNAKKYVYITSPYLICDYEILNSLCLAAKKGIDVKIITPHIPDKQTVFLMTRSNYEMLIESGVKIYEYTPGFIHAKEFICDDIYAVCGTINLDYRSLVHHFECGSWMYNCNCIMDMKKDFLETLEKSQEVKKDIYKLKGWKKLVAEMMKVYSPLF